MGVLAAPKSNPLATALAGAAASSSGGKKASVSRVPLVGDISVELRGVFVLAGEGVAGGLAGDRVGVTETLWERMFCMFISRCCSSAAEGAGEPAATNGDEGENWNCALTKSEMSQMVKSEVSSFKRFDWR
jgi:hypothetical protein